jgi:hypothetical protein
MCFFKFLLLVAFTVSSAIAKQDTTRVTEEVLNVESFNGSRQLAVLSRLSNATDPRLLVAIVPGFPSVAHASIGLSGAVLIEPSESFVVRERLRLLRGNIATLVLDCRSDFMSMCPDGYQHSEQRFKDVKVVIDLAKSKIPTLSKVWLLSSGRGMLSSVGIPKHSGNYFAGIIHTSGVTDVIADLRVEMVNTAAPQFFYHHVDDPCFLSKYRTTKLAAEKLQRPLVSVFGGGGFSGDPCGAFNQHGFKGMEESVMRHIVNLVQTGKVESLEIR